MIDRIQYAPRQGATYEAPLDILIPALMRLRQCDDSLKTLVLLDSLPDILIPALALVASRKQFIPAVAVKTTVRYCGFAFLERTLGKAQARLLCARYAVREVMSGVG